MDIRRDRASRRRRTSLDVESQHRKMAHAHPCTGAWTASCKREVARDGAWVAIFRRGCHRRVDRPRAPRNLRFPVGEELAGKSPAARISGGGGFREENKVTEMKHDHQKSKLLGYPTSVVEGVDDEFISVRENLIS